MAECEGLALVTLVKMENDQVKKGEVARVTTTTQVGDNNFQGKISYYHCRP
jgi:hypothetical protein